MKNSNITAPQFGFRVNTPGKLAKDGKIPLPNLIPEAPLRLNLGSENEFSFYVANNGEDSFNADLYYQILDIDGNILMEDKSAVKIAKSKGAVVKIALNQDVLDNLENSVSILVNRNEENYQEECLVSDNAASFTPVEEVEE
jgi:hypothetical protein